MTGDLRLVLFDVDGTLVDSQHNIVAAMEMACSTHGVEVPTPQAIRGIIGLSLEEAVATLLPEVEDATVARVAQAYKEAFLTLRSRPDFHEVLFPGVREVVDEIERHGYLMGLATGKARRGVDAFLARHGFEGRFVTIQTADDGPGKPHPRMGLSALAETGVEARNAVMVGDTTYDMMMGRAAGMASVGVSWGYHPVPELRAAGAQAVIESFAELAQVTGSLVGGAGQERGTEACEPV